MCQDQKEVEVTEEDRDHDQREVEWSRNCNVRGSRVGDSERIKREMCVAEPLESVYVPDFTKFTSIYHRRGLNIEET